MKIYFSGSITGGREHQEYYEIIIQELHKYGEVLSEFVGDKTLTSYGSPDMTPVEIYKRDVGMIEACDMVFADITTPSTGVGYEIAYAEKLQKPVYCVYLKTENKNPSSMIVGNAYCKTYSYTDKTDIRRVIAELFAQ
jgi:nucleoside 2-deoxyribosyltransferase